MAGVHHAMSGAAAAALGVKTLKEVVFDASGTFIVPANAIDNKFYVGCTGGGSSGVYEGGENGWSLPGAGNGRVSSQLTLAPGQAHTVTVGAGAINSYPGGASSFGGLLSCSGTNIWNNNAVSFLTGVNGGGNGGNGGIAGSGTASNCPAMFTLEPGAIDNTNKFYTAKSYAGGAAGKLFGGGGGGGCYGVGTAGTRGTPPLAPAPNTGAGMGASGWGSIISSGGSGKVVIYYYAYV